MARARNTDPKESHDAADSVIEVTATQEAIYKLLKKRMIDQDLWTEYQKLVLSNQAPRASESGVRSRRSELVELGLVERKGTAKTWSGRSCAIWGRI